MKFYRNLYLSPGLEKKKNKVFELLGKLASVFVKYYETISDKYGCHLVDKLNIQTCPYCNRQFIYTFKGRALERPELDHFYSKTKYPLFCLSFYPANSENHSVSGNWKIRDLKGGRSMSDVCT